MSHMLPLKFLGQPLTEKSFAEIQRLSLPPPSPPFVLLFYVVSHQSISVYLYITILRT